MSSFRRINFLALCLCFIVVVFGAFVRLSNAGLGCPDWPGCYGQLAVPQGATDVKLAEQDFPQRPVEAPKAWKEMIHRYLVGGLSILILAMALLALLDRGRSLPLGTALAIVAVVLVQIAFGAWTVTLKVMPLVVTTHLLLGLTTLSLIWWQWLRVSQTTGAGGPAPPRARALVLLALLLLVAQIFLGGWTSTNYAATACPDFPTCQGRMWPPTDFGAAFTLWRGLGVNYEFGVLDNTARVTIQLVHRCGAAIVGSALAAVAVYLIAKAQTPFWRRLGAVLLAAVLLQLTLGISLVLAHFPLWLGDAHNAGAALLLMTVVALNFFAQRDAAAKQ